MIETIKTPIKNMPKNLQVHAKYLVQLQDNYLAETNENQVIILELYNKVRSHFAKHLNKYMQNKHSKSWDYLLDYIDDYYVVVNLKYLN